MKFQITRTEAGRYRWQLADAKGAIHAQCYGDFETRKACQKSIDVVMSCANASRQDFTLEGVMEQIVDLKRMPSYLKTTVEKDKMQEAEREANFYNV
jgi:uncharacterized protein YegP (UPF0339 family)